MTVRLPACQVAEKDHLCMWGPACSPGCMMKAQRLGCLLWLLCMPAEVTLSLWKAYQSPSSISHVSVNSSFEITCATSLEGPLGVELLRHFHNKKKILFLSLTNGLIGKTTTAEEFKNRIAVTPDRQDLRIGFRLKLSLLGLDDTDLYYCKWHSNSLSPKSNGTVILVTERGPQYPCKDATVDFTLISLSAAVFTVTLLILIGALVWKNSRFIPGKPLRPSRCSRRPLPPVPPRPHRIPRPPRPDRPQHICLQQQIHQHWPYITTSTNPYGFENVR